MLRSIVKLLRVLNSETEPGQIGLAFSFAMIVGLTPFTSPHNLLVILLVLILRVNLSAFLLGLVVLTGIAYMLDPLFHLIGKGFLTAGALQGLWTTLYNITLFRLLNFNNTILMGSLLFSIVLFVPFLLATNYLIRKYREHILQWVQKTRFMQAFKATKFYRLYSTYSEIRGGV